MLALVIVLYAVYGFSFILGKQILLYSSPFFTVAVRMIAGGITLLTYMYCRQRIQCIPRRADLWLYLQHAVIGIYAFYSFRAYGLQTVSVTKAALLYNLLPFFTAVFAYFFSREKVSLHQGVGLIIGFIGMIPLLLTDSPAEELIGGLFFISWPELSIIASVASLAYSILLMQKLVKHRECPPALVNGMSMLVGGSMALISAKLTEPIWIRGDWKMLALLTILQIIASNLICANLHASLLRYHSPTFMSFASFLTPLSTIIYGWLFFGEHITLNFCISFVVVLIGLVIYQYKEIKEQLHKSY